MHDVTASNCHNLIFSCHPPLPTQNYQLHSHNVSLECVLGREMSAKKALLISQLLPPAGSFSAAIAIFNMHMQCKLVSVHVLSFRDEK